MRMTRHTAVAALGLTAALALTACSSAGTAGGGGSDGPQTVPTTKGDGETLTVWVMTGDYTDETIQAINDEFTEQTGAEVDVQTQQWDGITTKISTALATSTPPDVLDLGNTQVASYAENGALLDLSDYADDIAQGQEWLTGLEEPATVDGSLYGVPGFAGARAVIYNKAQWEAAGITDEPTTYDELTADLDALKAANPASDYSPFYTPGEYWYAGMQFVWDAGGEIATQGDDGAWEAGFSSPEAQQGLEDWQEFQNAYSTGASQTLDTDVPDQNQVFADGKTGAVLGTNGKIDLIKEFNPALTDDDFGTFPFPGKSGDSQPVMLGGSDWGIAAKSANSELALQWVKIAASPEIQNDWVYGNDGWIPNSTDGIEAAQSTLSDIDEGFFTAALNSKATPASGNWAALEGDRSINELFSSIASGTKSPEAAAEAFDSSTDDALNK